MLNITVFCAGIVMVTIGFTGISKMVDRMFDDIRYIYDNIDNNDTDLEKERINKISLFALHVTLIILFFVIVVLGADAMLNTASEM